MGAESILATEEPSGPATASVELTDVVLTTVKPAREKPHIRATDPTFFDLCCIDAYVPTIFAYRLENNVATYAQILDTIKKSLGQALIDYYPLAGRWIRTFDTKMRQLVCNDDGVPFIEAFWDEELDCVVKCEDFQPVKTLAGYDLLCLDFNAYSQAAADEYPALFVQITRFKCGGMVLTVTFNHMTVDGKSFYEFMNAWAELSLQGYTCIVPNHNRSLADSYEGMIPGFLDAEPSKSLDRQDYGVSYKAKDVVPLVWKTLHVRKEAVQEMKRQAMKGGEGETYVTTMDCITAHFCEYVAKISAGVRTTLMTVVDGRSRFYAAPLPKYFCGNVSLGLTLGPFTLGDSPIAKAKIVRSAVSAINASTWRSEGLKSLQVYGSDEPQSFYVSSWMWFPMYEVDFGFGKPYFSSCMNAYQSRIGFANILPPVPKYSPQSVATAYIGAPEKTLQALMEDPDFVSFFLRLI